MIRLKKLLENVLAERVSDVVYHLTYSNKFQKIIDADTFNLSKLSKADSAVDREWSIWVDAYDYYYMSVARSISSNFIQKIFRNDIVVLRLDGRKLNSNYKSIPFDFDYNKELFGVYTNSVGDEMEDRILSKKPTIKNFINYITGIYISNEYIKFRLNESKYEKLIKTVYELADRGIEIYICEGSSKPTFNSKCKVTPDEFKEIATRIWEELK